MDPLQKLEDLDFTDDLDLLSHTVGHLQAKSTRLCNIEGQQARSGDQCHKDQEYTDKCKPGSPKKLRRRKEGEPATDTIQSRKWR